MVKTTIYMVNEHTAMVKKIRDKHYYMFGVTYSERYVSLFPIEHELENKEIDYIKTSPEKVKALFHATILKLTQVSYDVFKDSKKFNIVPNEVKISVVNAIADCDNDVAIC